MNLDGHTCFKKQNIKLTLKVPNIQCKYHHLKFLAPLAASLKILHLKKKKKKTSEKIWAFFPSKMTPCKGICVYLRKSQDIRYVHIAK